MTNKEMLEEFHKIAGNHNDKNLRITLHDEEHEELIEALESENIFSIARELADVVYVAYGTAYSLGIDLDTAIKEVHRANMEKAHANEKRPDGKVIKHANFTPPDMTYAVYPDRLIIKG